MLAALEENANAYISIAGPARSASELLRTQLTGRLPPYLVTENERILVQLEKAMLVNDADPTLATLYRPSVQPYLISWFSVKPIESISKLNMPTAIFQGDVDSQVAASEAKLLASAKQNAELHIIKGMNHVLKKVGDDKEKQQSSYTNPNLEIDSDLVILLSSFLKKYM